MAALVHDRTNSVVAAHVEIAATRRARRKGLLGRASLDPASAMLITPCFAVHTIGMRFPIDVAFVDRDGRAVRLVHALKPWRAAAATGAYEVFELAAGRLAACGVREGDRLTLSSESVEC